jgi:isorenieratene synthase
MFRITEDAARRPLILFGRAPQPRDEDSVARGPDWTQARPPAIQAALARVSALPSGGWYVLDASRRIGERPSFYWVAGRELVAWRSRGTIRVAPNGCPHMSAPLSEGRQRDGKLVCPWHGLELGDRRHGSWEPLLSHDDGVLAWVRLDGTEAPTERPILAPRPDRYLEGTIRKVARCDPADVIANRLDPWHGAHFHPHSFARLQVLGQQDDALAVRVAFRVAGPLAVEVDCTFHCPEPRTIVMTIIDGEGAGSVVETHATPLAAGHTAIVETTLATSERSGFELARRAGALLRPLVERAAARLWTEDKAYAERTAYLRQGVTPAAWIEERGPSVTPGSRV